MNQTDETMGCRSKTAATHRSSHNQVLPQYAFSGRTCTQLDGSAAKRLRACAEPRRKSPSRSVTS